MAEKIPEDAKPDSPPPPPKPKVDPFSDAAQAALTVPEPAVSDDDELPGAKPKAEKEDKTDGKEKADDAAPKELTDDERTWALFSHLAALLCLFMPFGNLIGPGVVYLLKKDESKYVRFHAVQSFTFQLVVTAVLFALLIPFIIVVFLTSGMALIAWPCFYLVLLAVCAYAVYVGVQAQKGEFLLYPGVGKWAYKKVWEEDWKPL